MGGGGGGPESLAATGFMVTQTATERPDPFSNPEVVLKLLLTILVRGSQWEDSFYG